MADPATVFFLRDVFFLRWGFICDLPNTREGRSWARDIELFIVSEITLHGRPRLDGFFLRDGFSPEKSNQVHMHILF